MTDAHIPFWMGYAWQKASNSFKDWLEQRIMSFISPCEKTATLAEVLPISMIKCTVSCFTMQS
jgi:hypothetical protein